MKRKVYCHHCGLPMTRSLPDAPPAYPPRAMIWVRRWLCTNNNCPDCGVVTAEGNCHNAEGGYIHAA